MSDHIKALFEGQELTDEFKAKATAIVEAALNEREVMIREAVETELKADFDQRISERVAELEKLSESYVQDEVLPSIDKYLTAAVNEWLEENRVQLESGAKVHMAESFLQGLVGLAESHNLKISEAETTRIEELESQLSQVKENLNALTDRNITLMTENQAFKKEAVAASVTGELSESQKDKIASVVERIEYKDDEQYASAVKAVVESYFPAATDLPINVDDANVIAESEKQKQPRTYVSSLVESVLS